MKIGKIKYLVVMMIAGAFISCGSGDDSTVSAQETSFLFGNVLHDSRDGHTYKTVTIGTQTWMAENLSYKMDGTICPGDDYCKTHKCHQYYGYSIPDDNCNPLPDTTIWPVAGCYYRSKSAISACPKGWHLPSLDEWKILFEAVGGKDIAGKMLKASSGFCGDNGRNSNGTDAYGFNVLPTGHCSLLNWEYYYNRVCNGKTENGKCVDGRGDTLYVPGQDDYIIGGAFPFCILGGGAGFWTSTYLGSGLCVNTKEINFAACEPTEIDVYLRVSFDTEWHSDSPDDVYYRIPEELRTELGNEDYATLSSVRCLKDDASGPSTKSSSSMKKYSSSSTVKMSSSNEKTSSSSVAKSSSSSTAKSSSGVKITSSSSVKITSLSSSRE